MLQAFLNYNDGRKYILHSSRRLGKTYLLCVLAIMFAWQKANSQIRYASVTQKAVRKMIHPIMKELFAGLPIKFQGKWNSQEGAYIFGNGSAIHVAGVNNGQADNLRGTAAELCLVDEAAFVDELSYLVESVLIPQLITTNGKLIMASSSPLTPAHQFAEYIHAARIGYYYQSYTIDDGGYSQKTVDEFLKEAGGRDSTTARREYFNELIVDDSMAIIPEWKDDYIQTIQRDECFSYYHKYVSMDIGVRDKTVVLFGYYDFKRALLIIEDEWSVSGVDTTTKNIASNVKQIESKLDYKPYRRISDNNNLVLLQDLSSAENLHFSATTKDSNVAMINEVRLWIDSGRIIVNPKCEQLIGCLKYGVYQDAKRKEFGRSPSFGHYDALDALKYCLRNIDQVTNPIPANHKANFDTFISVSETDNTHSELKKIFNLHT